LQLAGIAIQILGLVACGGLSPPNNEPAQTLRVGIGAPIMAEESGLRALVSALTGEDLLRITNKGRIEPRLVERWSRSDDGLVWTFTLRSGLVFHDGSPVEADVIRDSLNAALAGPREPGLLDVDQVTAPDARTFVVSLRRPSSFLLEDLARVSFDSKSGGTGAGPFIEDDRIDDTIVLRAFERYHAGAPAIKRLELRSYANVRAAWTAMMRGEIDVLHEVARDALEFVQAESTVRIYSFPRAYVHTLGFNMAHPVLHDPAVRRALNHAVDRPRVVGEVLRGQGAISHGFIWPHHWAFDRSAPTYGFDRSEAARLLDGAGYRMHETASGPFRFAIRCLVPSDMPVFPNLALVVQRNLYDIGVDLQLEPIPAREMAERLGQGRFDAFLFEVASGRVLSWAYRFLHSPAEGGGLLRWGYRSADAVLDRLRHRADDNQVRADVSELQRVLYDDPPAVFISWDERSRAVTRQFEVPTDPGEDVFATAVLSRWVPAQLLQD
jgi:peptide/nickel transport system substrate-binding protein